MNFRDYLNEISFYKIRNLLDIEEHEIVTEFKKIFNYKDKINIKAVNIGGSSSPDGNITYSSKGILLHELFHLLQYKAMSTYEYTRYKNLIDIGNKDNFISYVLQRKELNNQAISISYILFEKNILIDDIIKEVKTIENIDNLDISNIDDRLKIWFFYMSSVKSKRKVDLFERIKKYRDYMVYLSSDSIKNETITYGPSFI